MNSTPLTDEQLQSFKQMMTEGIEVHINPTFEEYQRLVVHWAKVRKIIPNAKPHTQLLKAFEEMGELASGEAKNNMDLIQDSVGDVLVCLINYCEIRNIDLVGCLMLAYDEIKDRKGTLTPDGTFIKEEA